MEGGWAELNSSVCGLSLWEILLCTEETGAGLWAAFLWGDHSPHDPAPGLQHALVCIPAWSPPDIPSAWGNKSALAYTGASFDLNVWQWEV